MPCGKELFSFSTKERIYLENIRSGIICVCSKKTEKLITFCDKKTLLSGHKHLALADWASGSRYLKLMESNVKPLSICFVKLRSNNNKISQYIPRDNDHKSIDFL